MRLSKTGLRVLTGQYRSVLKKCFLINAGLFLISSTAMAADINIAGGKDLEKLTITEDTTITGDWGGWTEGENGKLNGNGNFSTIQTIVVSNNATLDLEKAAIEGDEDYDATSISVDNGKLTLNASSLGLSSDDYKSSGNFTNSTVEIINSELGIDGSVTLKDSSWTQTHTKDFQYDTAKEYGVEFRNLDANNATIIISDERDLPADKETFGVKDQLNITNGTKVTLNNNAVLAWNGQVYEEDENGNDVVVGIQGGVNIKNSTLTLNNASKLLIGMDDNEGADNNQATFDISKSTINLNDTAAIEFHAKNKENTTIKNGSVINMADESSMKLNAVTLSHSQIKMTDTASMVLDSVTLDNATITGETTNTITIGGKNYTEFKDTSLVAGAGAATATGGHLVSVQAGSKFGVVAFGKEVTINGENNDAAIYLQSGVDGTSTTDLNGQNYALTINGGILSDNVNNVVNFTGTVNFNGLLDPLTANIADGTTTHSDYADDIDFNLNSGGTLKYTSDKYLYDETKHGSTYANNSINFNGGLLDIANGEVTGIKLSKLSLSKESNIHVDADLANKTMDTLTADTIEANAKLNIAKLNLISDATEEITAINFTKDESLLKQVNYTGATSGLKALSPVYTYDVAYDNATGDFTFTRGGGAATTDYNPAVYGSATTSQTVGFLQQNIANAVFDNLGLQTFRPMGRASGDEPYSNHAWVSLFGADDNVEFDSFETVDSEMMSLAGGFNSDKIKLGDNYVGYGIYAGYLNGEGKYTGNEIDQEGGYIGLSSSLQNGNFVMVGTINGGFIKNEAKHSFGTDKYDTYWTGVSLKTGYDYHVNNSLTIRPNVYAGYSFVNSEDYTSKSGAKIKNDNLHLFEVAPGLKVNQTFANGWNGFAQAKYAFVMDNGGDTNIDSVVLPNISVKDYVEYGLGVEKDIRSDWSLAATINRRDGGRQGWNGSLTVKYNF